MDDSTAPQIARNVVIWHADYGATVTSIDREDEPLRCAESGRKPRPQESADDEWDAGSDGLGELHVFCPQCWERELGAALREPEV